MKRLIYALAFIFAIFPVFSPYVFAQKGISGLQTEYPETEDERRNRYLHDRQVFADNAITVGWHELFTKGASFDSNYFPTWAIWDGHYLARENKPQDPKHYYESVVLQELLYTDQDINLDGPQYLDGIFYLTTEDDWGIFETVLKLGARPKRVLSQNGLELTMINSKELVDMLINYGGDLNYISKDNYAYATLFMYVAELGSDEMFDYLINKPLVDFYVTDVDNYSAFDYALSNENEEKAHSRARRILTAMGISKSNAEAIMHEKYRGAKGLAQRF